MGVCCRIFGPSNEVEMATEFKENDRRIFNDNKYFIYFQLFRTIDADETYTPKELDVIHIHTVGSIMPVSREYIDKGNKLLFIYNTVIHTDGKGKGDRKWLEV